MGRGDGEKGVSDLALKRATPTRRSRRSSLRGLGLEISDLEGRFALKSDERWPGLLLITPAHGEMMRFSDWDQRTLPLRSLVVRDDPPHEIVSMGFPKFGNWDEDDEGTALIRRALDSESELTVTEKIDGSLVVRSVVDGEVMIRTRGSLSGAIAELAREVAEKSSPRLMDPDWMAGESLLMELTSPQTRVIIPHSVESLTILGVASHETAWVTEREDVERAAQEAGLAITPAISADSGAEEIFTRIRGWRGREGVVIQDRESGALLRLKSEEYLRLHLLRFNLTPRSIRELCEREGISDLDSFTSYIERQDADWELISESRSIIEEILKTRSEARDAFNQLRERATAEIARVGGDRKRFAVEFAMGLPDHQRSSAFMLFNGDLEGARAQLESKMLDIKVRELSQSSSW